MYGGHDRRGTRKPLIIFTPKSLLRHPKAVSTLQDFTSGGFTEILSDSGVNDNAQVSRVVFCSGKVYYDLLAAREERQANHVALIRVEQLYPFAADQARDILARYSRPPKSCGRRRAAQHGSVALRERAHSAAAG